MITLDDAEQWPGRGVRYVPQRVVVPTGSIRRVEGDRILVVFDGELRRCQPDELEWLVTDVTTYTDEQMVAAKDAAFDEGFRARGLARGKTVANPYRSRS